MNVLIGVTATYSLSTMGVAHSSWMLSLGVLAHIFKQVKCQCRLRHLSTEEIAYLRKLHLSTCELLRDINDIYSIQILSSITLFFALLAFRCYAIVMHFTKPGVNNLVIFEHLPILFFIYTLSGITIWAHMCISQVFACKSCMLLLIIVLCCRRVRSNEFSSILF